MSSPEEILKKVRRIELKTKKLVDSIMSGQYHTRFKGHGMQFADLREYYIGDDIRHIDWKVTARTQTAHIKKFEEERELNVYFLVDFSRSGLFSSVEKTKTEILAETVSLLIFAALRNGDKVGLILFTDDIELHLPPKKGHSHGLRLVRELLFFEPKSRKTNIGKSIDFCLNVMKQKGVVFLVSDFIDDEDYFTRLKRLRRKQDVIALRVVDPKEKEFPRIGFVEVIDSETGEISVVNSWSKNFRKAFGQDREAFDARISREFKSGGVGEILISTEGDYLKKVISYFLAKGKKK